MFRETDVDSALFQQTIHMSKCKHSKYGQHQLREKRSIGDDTEAHLNDDLAEVPSIQNLKQQVKQLISIETTMFEELNVNSWNDTFHRIIKECNLVDCFPIDTLPPSYQFGKSCGHVFQVELKLAYNNSFYLTMLETIGERLTVHSSKGTSKFMHAVLFTNPIWDIGLQFTLAKRKVGTLYVPNSKKVYPFRQSVSVLVQLCLHPGIIKHPFRVYQNSICVTALFIMTTQIS